MQNTKSLFSSRTILANIVGFVCLVLSMLGVNTGFVDQSIAVELILQIISALSFIASTIYRLIATKLLD